MGPRREAVDKARTHRGIALHELGQLLAGGFVGLGSADACVLEVGASHLGCRLRKRRCLLLQAQQVWSKSCPGALFGRYWGPEGYQQNLPTNTLYLH